jgi:hypothetical protein
MTRSLLCFLLLVLMAIPASASDPGMQPVLIGSFASVKALRKDLNHLGRGIRHPGLADAVGDWLTAVTSVQQLDGVDLDRRYGACIASNGLDVVGIVCIPVSDFEKLMTSLPPTLSASQEGKGLYKIGELSLTGYVKHVGDWACLAQSPEVFDMLPSPETILGEVPETHDAFVRLYVQRIPEAMRTMAVDRIRESWLPPLGEETVNPDSDLQRVVQEFPWRYLDRVLLEAERVDLSWSLDALQGISAMECILVPLPETDLAEAIAGLGENHQVRRPAFAKRRHISSLAIDWPLGALEPRLPPASIKQLFESLRSRLSLPAGENHSAALLLDTLSAAAQKRAIDEDRLLAAMYLSSSERRQTLLLGMHVGKSGAAKVVEHARQLAISPRRSGPTKPRQSLEGPTVYELGRIFEADAALAKICGARPPVRLGLFGETAWLTIGEDALHLFDPDLKLDDGTRRSHFQLTAASGDLLPLFARLTETAQQDSAMLDLLGLQLRSLNDRTTFEIVAEDGALITRASAAEGVLQTATLGLSIAIQQYLKNSPPPGIPD